MRAGPSISTALRFAFQPPTGRASGSARMVAASAALGVALFAGALGFAASLDNVQHTPAAHGWNWDLAVINSFGTIPDDALQSVLDAPAVDESAAFTTGPVTIAGTQIAALGIDPKAGAVYLTMTSGRAPLSANEIVLGASTLRTVDASLGDRIVVTTPQGDRTMTVVGVATFPAIGSARFGSMSLGDGAATIASVLPVPRPDRHATRVSCCDWFSSGSRAERIDEMRDVARRPRMHRFQLLPARCASHRNWRATTTSDRSDSRSGRRSRASWSLPLGYGIISTVHSRRRELAVLRALGMTRHQVSAVVILHAIARRARGRRDRCRRRHPASPTSVGACSRNRSASNGRSRCRPSPLHSSPSVPCLRPRQSPQSSHSARCHAGPTD